MALHASGTIAAARQGRGADTPGTGDRARRAVFRRPHRTRPRHPPAERALGACEDAGSTKRRKPRDRYGHGVKLCANQIFGGALPRAAAGAPQQTLRPAAGTLPRDGCASPEDVKSKGQSARGAGKPKRGGKKIKSFCPLFLELVARLELATC